MTVRRKPEDGARRGPLAALRAELARRSLCGFLVPRADEYRNEYVPPRAERLAWLSGFTGSAGLAVVLAEEAALFVDGRYTLQARAEVDGDSFALKHLTDDPPEEWLSGRLGRGGKLGYDPWLHSAEEVEKLGAACGRAKAELVSCAENPVDAVWTDQPQAPLAPAVPWDIRYAGKSAADKRSEAAESLKSLGAAATVLTAPDSVAWLLNMRGGDVAHTPLALCFAILRDGGEVELFLDSRKSSPGLEAHLGPQVALFEPGELAPALDRLAAGKGMILLDPERTASWFFDRIAAAGGKILRGEDVCALAKACKNEVELAGMRAAHLRDGAALARFLAWLAREAPRGGVTELEAAQRLAALRRENDRFRDLSFPTVSASGPNGAVVHYRASEKSNRRLEPGELYLVDSGAQYLDGTTDVTRTVFVSGSGAPGDERRERFTRVLKGHVAIATARFPPATTGSALDALARRHLWDAGLDFDHGAGHGVGCYLSVHEGPQRISRRPNRVALKPGMIVSNEPGYYKAGEYGIRIENLLAVVEGPPIAGGEREMLAFETLTLAPIDLALVAPQLLSEGETAWLDSYHEKVRAALTPLIEAEEAAWLREATRPLAG